MRFIQARPNKSFQLTGPLVTRLAMWESRQAARPPSRQLNSTVRRYIDAHRWSIVNTATKRCAVCSFVFSSDNLQCPQCGSGVFASEKTRSESAALRPTSDTLPEDKPGGATPVRAKRRTWLERLGLKVSRNEHPVKTTMRLSSILIVIGRDPGEHQVLVDRLLDLPTEKAGGIQRRMSVDLDTKCQVHISDYASKKMDQLLMYVSFSNPLFVDLQHPDRMDSLSFDVGDISGRTLECWDDTKIKTSPVLRCTKCGKLYDLTRDAATATMDSAFSDSSKRGRYVIKLSGKDTVSLPDPDLVMTVPNVPSPANKKELNYVVSCLRAGQSRRWDCGVCQHVQGYPGSFIQYGFPEIS
jgi:DNA-directed RNA polymerase subunit RPC12/RpoP